MAKYRKCDLCKQKMSSLVIEHTLGLIIATGLEVSTVVPLQMAATDPTEGHHQGPFRAQGSLSVPGSLCQEAVELPLGMANISGFIWKLYLGK